ncbi:hypothetical protein [Pseudocowpox virus]|uniref:Uncharacterized protein n=1 Tax=Pseudocowpox virus TaxID=129726 RepID=D3IZQ6_9POXV|nr:hypothetical protein PCPV_gp111 [Pseudocowpox virus]ADC54010.1 hypothetical protein [Pseudocowpox virus]
MVLAPSELLAALAECVITRCAAALLAFAVRASLLAFAVRASLPRDVPRRDDARPHGL